MSDTDTFERAQAQGLAKLVSLGTQEPPDRVPDRWTRAGLAIPETEISVGSLKPPGKHRGEPSTPVDRHAIRFTKFAVVGAVVFAAGTLLQWLLMHHRVASDWAYVANMVLSVEFAYALNRWRTWNDRDVAVLGSLLRWNVQKLALVVPNCLFYDLLVHLGTSWMVANAAATAIFSVINYVGGNFWAFAPVRNNQTAVVRQDSYGGTDAETAILQRSDAPVSFWRRHSVFLAILGLGVVLRAVVVAAYFPAFWYSDSFGYVGGVSYDGHVLAPALDPYPYMVRPVGYSLLVLWPLRIFHSVALVAGVQAAFGLVAGTLIYALLRRRFQFAGWTAALAAAPVLLSAYELQLEHFMLSDTLFMLLTVAALVLALWYRVPPVWACGVVGALLAAAGLTRTEGLPLVAAFAFAILVSCARTPQRLLRVSALLICFALPMGIYATWFKDIHGTFELESTYGGAFLGARVEPFANCSVINPPTNERWLCLNTPTSSRLTPDDYLWGGAGPTPLLNPPTGPRFSARTSAIAEEFAMQAIEHQPVAYGLSVAQMFFQPFSRGPYTDGQATFMFPSHQPETVLQLARAHPGNYAQPFYQYNGGHNPDTQFSRPWADILQVYQQIAVVPPPVLGGIVLVGLAGLCLAFRRRGGPALLPWVAGVVMLLTPAMASSYEARYVVPAVPFFCVAMALAAREIGDRRDLRHHVFMVSTVVLSTALLFALQDRFWPYQGQTDKGWLHWWSLGSLIWLSATIPALCELVGMVMYRPPKRLNQVRPCPQLVCWRIVSRGLNKEALRATIHRCRLEMAATPLFPYVIEVVIDTSPEGFPAPARDLHYFVVPHDYWTKKGTKAKARALNYALENSPLPDRAWIVHLDEETHPTRSGIQGIARMIAEEEASGQLRIGQGTIVYHRNWAEHPLLTLSDCIRTGSDLGRLYLSMAVGIPLFGLHGSFIVVRNDVEKRIGFDLGPMGSTTEDAWWGCMQMETGRRCRWVDGHCEEQSTESLRDFAKQRRRWFCGLVMTALACPVRLRYRVVIGLSMLAWALTPLAWMYTILHFALGGFVSPEVHVLADVSFAAYVTATFVGLRVNLNEHGIRHPGRRIGWFALWVVMMPAFSLLEAGSIGYAMLRPNLGFHVVKK